jgi:hypothetical protein
MKASTEAGSLGGSKLNLRYKANAHQVLRERAGVARLLGVGVLQGNDARLRLKREVNARRVPRWGAGVVDSLDS